MYVCISPAGYLLTVSFFSGYFAPPFSLPIQEPLASMHTLVGYFTYIYVRSLPLYLLLYVQYVRGPSSPSIRPRRQPSLPPGGAPLPSTRPPQASTTGEYAGGGNFGVGIREQNPMRSSWRVFVHDPYHSIVRLPFCAIIGLFMVFYVGGWQ